ncbi:MAG: putative endonuclease [Verrucomicrobiales bacterium]|jgi:putative endonuclease
MMPPSLLYPLRYLTRRYSPLLTTPPDMFDDNGERWDKDVIGAFGEKLAAHYLWAHGCGILYRNYRAPKGGEVDIVCRHSDMLVFAEVKTRTSNRYGRPMDAVDTAKERLITRGAMAWLRLLNRPEIFFRFDVIEIILPENQPPEVTWVKEAFGLPKTYRY